MECGEYRRVGPRSLLSTKLGLRVGPEAVWLPKKHGFQQSLQHRRGDPIREGWALESPVPYHASSFGSDFSIGADAVALGPRGYFSPLSIGSLRPDLCRSIWNAARKSQRTVKRILGWTQKAARKFLDVRSFLIESTTKITVASGLRRYDFLQPDAQAANGGPRTADQ
jgi:hypothetical protein